MSTCQGYVESLCSDRTSRRALVRVASLMVISGPVGFHLGDDPSGLRIVKVYDDRVEHQYFGMDDVPISVGW